MLAASFLLGYADITLTVPKSFMTWSCVYPGGGEVVFGLLLSSSQRWSMGKTRFKNLFFIFVNIFLYGATKGRSE